MLFHDPDAFLAEIEEIAGLGAERLMAYWRALEPDQINEKARNDLVSAADLASEEAIMEAIRSRFPDHSILSEEAGRSTPTSRCIRSDGAIPTRWPSATRCWRWAIHTGSRRR